MALKTCLLNTRPFPVVGEFDFREEQPRKFWPCSCRHADGISQLREE